MNNFETFISLSNSPLTDTYHLDYGDSEDAGRPIQEYKFERQLLGSTNSSDPSISPLDPNVDSISRRTRQTNSRLHFQELDDDFEERHHAKHPVKNKSTKNIVKNYGNAMASFATSPLVIPYIQPLLRNVPITVGEFQNYVHKKKDKISGIDTLKSLLEERIEDDMKVRYYKRLFRYVCEVFIKYFSVNWIYSSKLKYRDVHLKFRNKMLRRIRNPMMFTYVTGKALQLQ